MRDWRGSVPLSPLLSGGMSPSLISLNVRISAALLSKVDCRIEPIGSRRIRICAKDAKECDSILLAIVGPYDFVESELICSGYQGAQPVGLRRLNTKGHGIRDRLHSGNIGSISPPLRW